MVRAFSGALLRKFIEPPKVALPMVEAVPGPRSIWASPMSWAMNRAEEVWCRSVASPNGMPSKVTLNWPSWNPRRVRVSLLPRPGPLGLWSATLGENLTMSSKLASGMMLFWMNSRWMLEVGWTGFTGAAEGDTCTAVATTSTVSTVDGAASSAAKAGAARMQAVVKLTEDNSKARRTRRVRIIEAIMDFPRGFMAALADRCARQPHYSRMIV